MRINAVSKSSNIQNIQIRQIWQEFTFIVIANSVQQDIKLTEYTDKIQFYLSLTNQTNVKGVYQ